jgi:vancomycin permeability regulator SanA
MTFNQELDSMWEKDNRIAQLEEELAKVTARYNCVRDMTPEYFGNLSTINEDFDRQIDAAIKDQQ